MSIDARKLEQLKRYFRPGNDIEEGVKEVYETGYAEGYDTGYRDAELPSQEEEENESEV